ncbi:hypothetical protein [Pontixanthobacter sp.]|uniref:hypothetical protein n=1 Tax=Pontixanthobacter sp. TaxID=2792078 RepID=UPI003C7B6241
MSKTVILYVVVTVQLALGLFILIDAFPMFEQGLISPLSYVVRGFVPLVLAATFIFLARQARAKEGSGDA